MHYGGPLQAQLLPTYCVRRDAPHCLRTPQPSFLLLGLAGTYWLPWLLY